MKRMNVVVLLVSLFVVFYNVAPYINISDNVILAMFCIAPFLTVYMVYAILKYGRPSEKTFEDIYYEDIDNES